VTLGCLRASVMMVVGGWVGGVVVGNGVWGGVCGVVVGGLSRCGGVQLLACNGGKGVSSAVAQRQVLMTRSA
jgi:hypothetical protein